MKNLIRIERAIFGKTRFLYQCFFLLLFTSYSNVSFTQNVEPSSLDSLHYITNDLATSKKERIDAYLALSECYLEINLDSAKQFAQTAQELSIKSKYLKGESIGLIREGQVNELEGNIENSTALFLRAILLYEDLEKDKELLLAYNMLAYQYENQGSYDQALLYYMEGLDIAEVLADELIMAYFYNNIANIFNYTKRHKEGFNYQIKALSIFHKLDQQFHYANSLVNIGNYYGDIERYDSARFYFNKAEKKQLELDNYYGLMNVYINFGYLELEVNELNRALDYFLMAKNAALKIDTLDPYRDNNIVKVDIEIGKTYLLLKSYSTAFSYFNRVLKHSSERNYQPLLAAAYSGISSYYEEMNQPDSALHFYKLFKVFNDSLIQAKYNREIDQLNFERKLAKEKNQSQLQSVILKKGFKRKELIYLLILIGTLFLLMLFISVFILLKSKMKQNALKREAIVLNKEKIEKDLNYKNKQLTTNVMYLIRKNEFIENISEKLKKTSFDNGDKNQQLIASIIHELDKSSSNDWWKEFEVRFYEVHEDFYNKLLHNYPDLSPNEQKLCAFLYLKMSTKEIASITYQSYESLRTARYRLRKKLGVSRDENLVSFLGKL